MPMTELATLRAVKRMPSALIPGYQKSVGWHTLHRLHIWLRATGSRRADFAEDYR